jgi:hypothetical protein
MRSNGLGFEGVALNGAAVAGGLRALAIDLPASR